MSAVSLVIPGRNCADTLRACLDSVTAVAARPGSALTEILFVDDGSTDETPAIAAEYPGVTVLQGGGNGPGAARNQGWRAAQGELVWFVDSDCVAASDALELLLPHLEDDQAAAVSGSYDNAREGELLPTLIHEEIVERHLAMGTEVDFLATFNVLYRRDVLVDLDGFDERYLKAQDAELSFRAAEAGWKLRFELRSRVAHHHERSWPGYLRTQRQQGYWRVFLHLEHAGHGGGDSYSKLGDHLQPPLALLVLGMMPAVFLGPPWRWLTLGGLVLLVLMQLPMTLRLVRRTGSPMLLLFGEFSVLRAFWRAVGMLHGMLAYRRRGARGAAR